MEVLKKLMNNTLFKIITKVIRGIIILFIITFVLVVYLQRFSDNKISIGGFRMFVVVSESMLPEYRVGDVLFAKNVPFKDIKIGDDISYLSQYGHTSGMIVTHRVIAIEERENRPPQIIAKGINNPAEDPPIHEDQIYGIITGKSNILSFIYRMVSNNLIMFFCIILPLMILVSWEIVATMVDKEDKRRKNIANKPS